MEDALISCPFCGETISVLVDTSVADQSYIEDCSVCCRPIQFRVRCSQDAVVGIEVGRS